MRHFCRFGGSLYSCSRQYTAFIQRADSKVRTPTIFRRTRLFSNTPGSDGRTRLSDVHAKAAAELVEKVDYEHYMLSIFFDRKTFTLPDNKGI